MSSEPVVDSIHVPDRFSLLTDKAIMEECIVKDGIVVKKPNFKDTKKLRAAFISVLGIQCGIATYSEWLWPKLGKHFEDWQIFAEVTDGLRDPNSTITRCWKRGQPLNVLVAELERFGPDIVYIQHEWGIFPDARWWLSLISTLQARYRVVTTFHSVYPEHPDKLICLGAAREVIVHTASAQKFLTAAFPEAKVWLVPHGCLPNDHEPAPWNMFQSEHTIVQFGFGFRYKGWHVALEVVNELRDEFPDVFFTGLYSIPANAGPDVGQYYNELQKRIDQLDLRQHVALVQGFFPEDKLRDYLRMHRVGLFPYLENPKHRVYGCSGAARYTMSQGVPIVTRVVPLFEDLAGVVPQGDRPRELAAAVRDLFQAPLRRLALTRQDAFLEQNSWARAGERYAAVLGF